MLGWGVGRAGEWLAAGYFEVDGGDRRRDEFDVAGVDGRAGVVEGGGVGILGEYVGRIFEESKGRPLYIVADAWNVAPRSAPDASDRPSQLEHQPTAPERR